MLSIVILNWNGCKMMQRYLPSVVEYSHGADIIVADNASTDESLQMLERDFPDVRVIPMARNWGFANGYNNAFKVLEAHDIGDETPYKSPLRHKPRKSDAPILGKDNYYLLLNSDVRVEEGWLTPLLEYMDSHSDVAACQPKLLSDSNPQMFEYSGACGGFIDKYGYPYCRGRVFGVVENDEGQYDEVTDVLWASGACLMIRASDYWAAGGLDGRFFAHHEEIDLCWRLNLMGRRVVCVPQSRVYHLGGGTLPQGNPRKTYLNFRNNLTMLYKNLPDDSSSAAPLSRSEVLYARKWLDRLAELKMLLTFHWGDYRAVVRARRDFNAWKAKFDEEHEKIQKKSAKRPPVGPTDVSILWQFYVNKKKTFSQMKSEE